MSSRREICHSSTRPTRGFPKLLCLFASPHNKDSWILGFILKPPKKRKLPQQVIAYEGRGKGVKLGRVDGKWGRKRAAHCVM